MRVHGRKGRRRGRRDWVEADVREPALHIFILSAQEGALLRKGGEELDRLGLGGPAREVSEHGFGGFEVNEVRGGHNVDVFRAKMITQARYD